MMRGKASGSTTEPSGTRAERGYFTRDLFEFLQGLRRNNNREWFERNRERYEAAVRGPCLRFIGDLAPRLSKISRHFVADPRPVGGSMMRIHRDIRFSKDKSPYKTVIGLHFSHQAEEEGAPAFYLHIAPDDSFAGGGIWQPPPPALKRVRDAIAGTPARWERARKVFDGRAWRMVGTSLKRVPTGFDPAHPFAEDIKRKDFAGSAAISDKDLCSADIPEIVVGRFREMAPFMQFLTEAVRLPF
jgi:uncharacterized protein (TIGR02453 family)